MASTIFVDGSGIKKTVRPEFSGSVTLYVRSGGSDSNNGLTVGTALATIQAAINKLPPYVNGAVVIDVGSGSFANFNLNNRHLGYGGSITIQGVMKTATVATGPTSGTSTGGTVTTLVLTSAGWTANNLRGKFLNVTGAGMYVIEGNTTDTITVTGWGNGTSLSGKAFVIQEVDTTVACTSTCRLSNITGPTDSNALILKQLRFTGASLYSMSLTAISTYMDINTCRDESAWGMVIDNCASASMTTFSGTGAAGASVTVRYGSFVGTDVLVYSSGTAWQSAGLVFWHVLSIGLIGSVLSQGTTGDGILLHASCGSLNYVNVVSNARHGVHLVNGSRIRDGLAGLTSTIKGTSNTRFGVNVEKDCTLFVNGSTTVTGTLGDFSLDNSLARTWSTSFPSNGDILVSNNTGSRVERVD